jgi:hypothetical protein
MDRPPARKLTAGTELADVGGMKTRGLLLAGLVALLAPDARAEPAPTRTRNYGWQILTADVATLGVTAGALKLDQDTAGRGILGVGVLLAAPGIHLLHGNPGRAVVSLTARITLFVLFARAYESEPDGGDLGDVATPMLGMAAFMLGDALFANETLPARAPRPAEHALRALSPTIRADRHGGWSLGVSGRF